MKKMANLKRTYIELVKNPDEVKKGGKVELEKLWTPAFMAWGEVRQGVQALMEYEAKAESEFDAVDKLEEFIADVVFDNSITVDDLRKRLHAPDAIKEMRELVGFVTSQGNENDETKEFVAKKG